MNQKQQPVAEKPLYLLVLTSVRHGLMALLIFCLPLLFYIHNSDMSYPKSILSLVGVSLLLVLWGAQWLLEGKAHLRLPALFWPSVVLLVAAAASLFQATQLGVGLQSLAMLAYFFLLYCLIANQTVTFWQVKLYLGVALGAVLVIGVYSFLQHAVLLPSSNDGTKLIASLGNPVAVAQYVNSLMIAGMVLVFLKHRFWPVKVFWGLAILLGFLTLALTKTTGPLISFMLALLVLLVALLWLQKRLQPVVPVRAWLIALLIVLLLSGWLIANKNLIDVVLPRVVKTETVPAVRAAGLPLFDPALEWAKTIWESNSGDLRSFYWQVGLEMWKAHPLLGIGLGHYKLQYTHYAANVFNTAPGKAQYQHMLEKYAGAPTLIASRAHNDYVQAVAEMGGLGLLAILGVLFAMLRHFVRQIQRVWGWHCLLLLFIYAGTLVFLIDALVNFPGHLPASSLNLVLLLGVAHSRYFYSSSKTVALKRTGSRLLALVFISLGIGVSFLAIRDWQANLHLERGIELLLNDEPTLAQQQFQQSLALDFAPADVFYHLGTLNLALGRTALAKQYFQRSLQSKVFDDTLWKLANLSFQEQDYEGARRYLDHFQVMFISNQLFLESSYLDALIELRLGRVEHALEIAEQTLTQHPEFEQIYLVLGDVALVQKNYPQAYLYYEHAKTYLEQQIIELEALNQADQTATTLQQLIRQHDEVLSILAQLQKVL